MGVGIRGQCPQTVAPMKICFEHFTKTNISPQTLKPGYGSGVGDKNPVIYRNAEQAHMTVKSDQTYSLGFLLKAVCLQQILCYRSEMFGCNRRLLSIRECNLCGLGIGLFD